MCGALRLFALVLALAASPTWAGETQKKPGAEVRGLRFISGPKGQRPHLPGLNAALLLTDQQKARLAALHSETLASEAVLSASRKVKSDPNATEADREAARKLAAEARDNFDRKSREILTPSQRELLDRVQVLYHQALEDVAREFAPQLVASKGNKEETLRLRTASAEKLAAEFARRASEILTPEQRGAFEREAALERAAALKEKPAK